MRLSHKKIANLAFGGIVCILLMLLLNWYWHRNSTFYNFVFTPDDFWSPLFSSSIDLANPDEEVTGTINHYYPGLYTVDVYVEHPLDRIGSYDSDFYLNFRFSDNQNTIMESGGNHQKSPFWEDGRETGGMILHFYNVPDDIPIREDVTFSAVVARLDPDFQSKFGNAELRIRKRSDE